jgi:hypothetical protein
MSMTFLKGATVAATTFMIAAVFTVVVPRDGHAQTNSTATIDSVSPVFRSDSSKQDAIRKVEAGVAGRDSTKSIARADSLRKKMKTRGPYVGVSLGVSFAEHSARDRFTNTMSARATAAGQRILQRQDPVHVLFPAGLLVGFPVLPNFDVMVRTEHSYYRVAGLSQKDNEAATEHWYVNQTHLAGAGGRWLVPVSLLSVNGESGLYLGYTHFWNFGPTGIRSPDGRVAATFKPTGAGMELQAGFVQDFDKRWALTGGFAWSRLSFKSDDLWANVAPASSAPSEQAEWSVSSMRFAMQGVYQFGRTAK